MSNNPTKTKAWAELSQHKKEIENQRINDYFRDDSNRFNALSFSISGLLYDVSKTHLTPKTISLLGNLAREQNLEDKRHKLFNKNILNKTENRSVLHTNLRDESQNLDQLENISNAIRAGKYVGATGKPIKNIVHIGLGGSSLGPELLHQACQKNKIDSLNFYFVTNVDGSELSYIFETCDPETTLFIIVSKSFTTQDTFANAHTARSWLEKHYQDKNFINDHFIAVTAKPEKALEFGISSDNTLIFDEGVGGRFSLWSAVGLTTCIAFGIDKFKDLLRGAHAMDVHFANEEFDKNIPVLMGLIDIWHRNFWNYEAKAILPYAQELKALPAYLQQLEMESNGKSTDLDGNAISYQTSPVIFGDVGTTAQHSFFQLLHQGINIIPCEFIGIKKPTHNLNDHHDKLQNNLLAQSQALLQGRDANEPHRKFEGNRPSSTIVLNEVDAYHLGMLIALYEHKVFVQSIIWNINPFDQFGVELGKEMANKMGENDLSQTDPSTQALFSILKDK